MPKRLALFATTARGTEDLLASELQELGAVKIRQDRGGVRFLANIHEALRICLWTRVAMRVLYPLTQAEVEGADGLYAATHEVPWEEHLTTGSSFAVEASLNRSEHGHSGFVALKIKDAIVDRMREKTGERPNVDTRRPVVRIVAHIARKHLSLSLDLCGDALFKRGYRGHSTPAPLKETLAAALLRAAEYRGDEPLLDPLCGSGTIAIEGAWIAQRRPPCLERSLAVESWPHMGQEATQVLSDLRSDARNGLRLAPFPITAIDKSMRATTKAAEDAERAGVLDAINFKNADAIGSLGIDIVPPGVVVTNPPYGNRVGGGGSQAMKNFYYRLGESLSALENWRLFILAGNPQFESAFHRRPKKRRKLFNGKIPCDFNEY